MTLVDATPAGRCPARPDPLDPVAGDRPNVDLALARERRGLARLTPRDALVAAAAGALLVDTRTETQRAEQGELPGAVVIDRTVLEWRLDPTSLWRIDEATDPQQVVIVVCSQGYSSSFAAAALQRIGLPNATDMIGGFEAWVADGLPVHRGTADVRR